MGMYVIKAALLGAGTVGSGVYALSGMLADEMIQKTGGILEIKKVMVRDLNKNRDGIPCELLTSDWNEILSDDEIQLVIEVMGGVEPTRTYIEQAIMASKQVVTANKDLLAEHGQELLMLAEERGVDLQFEAAVAGAIPIIRPLKQNMTAGLLNEICGIVNGTTNFILTKMAEEGMGYEEALAMATELGYAETDPTADVEGYDAGRKMAIIASLAYSSNVVFSDVYTEGITKITAEDMYYAKEFGYVIKLVGIAKTVDGQLEVRVHPMLIPDHHPLASVRDSFNAVFIHGDACDDEMFMGRGAGKMPTASAVMGDVMTVIRNILHDNCGWNGGLAYKRLPVKAIEETKNRFFLRLKISGKTGTLANIASVLGNNDVNIHQVVSKFTKDGTQELVITTGNVLEQDFNNA
ncbi:MAG: homoserine dehydrogenase, partial [Lachnospiraceae bacterium]|nr:homoserine dehydrogenase [Lachnospiraceae bacterium]